MDDEIRALFAALGWEEVPDWSGDDDSDLDELIENTSTTPYFVLRDLGGIVTIFREKKVEYCFGDQQYLFREKRSAT